MSFWRNLPHHRRTVIGGLFLGTVVTLVTLIFLQGLPIFTKAELTAYDVQFLQRGDRPIPKNIVIVGVDSTSITDLSKGVYPVPRAWVGKAIDFLHKSGATAIGLDFRYFNASIYGAKDDAGFVAAVRRAGNVVPVSQLEGASATNLLGAVTSVTLPIDQVANAARAIGVSNVPVDDDSKIRRTELFQVGPGGNGIGTKLYPSFPLVVAAVALHKTPQQVAAGLPNELYINYNGHQDPGDASQQSFRIVQFESVARGEDAPAIFKNKIVLIIPAAIAANDTHTGPFGTIYGGFVQANALNTILNRDPIIPAGGGTNTLIFLIMGLITTVVTSRFGIVHSASTFLVLLIGYALVAWLLFSQFRIWVNLVTPETGLVLIFMAIMALRFATEERLKRKAKEKFGLYVKPEVVDLLINTPDAEKALAGARRPISNLFVDIRGFTAMSEGMAPEDVVSALDIYLEELTESVQEHDGTVDKYVGDELMAIWNAPRFQEDHPLLAVKCALDMVARTENINRQLNAKKLRSIRFGIGVNTGEAIVGEMGSSFRKQYDVIGDSVNTGARLCSAAAGGEVIIGQITWELIGNQLVVEETEPLRLKGKSQPLRTFKVLQVLDEPVAAPMVAAPAPA